MAYIEYIIKDGCGTPYEHKFIFDTDGELKQQIDLDKFLDVTEMGDYVLAELSDDDINALKSFKFDDLISLHHNVGQEIRNAFGLWVEGNPNVSIDADSTSQEVIEYMWTKVTTPTASPNGSQVMEF